MKFTVNVVVILVLVICCSALAAGEEQDCDRIESVGFFSKKQQCIRLVFTPTAPACMALMATAGVASGVAATFVMPVVLTAFGFGAAGVAGGSFAAWMQKIGGTSALFATLQSAGAAGVGISTKALVGLVGASASSVLVPVCFKEEGFDM